MNKPHQPNPAHEVIANEGFTFNIPIPRKITVPWDQLAFAGGVTVLAAASIIEWPLAAVLAVGHVLVSQHHSRTLTAFGEALAQREE
jgi:hypothetical protein